MGGVSENAARLLRDVDLVRFVPNHGFSGTATITYHAWDQTQGICGQMASLVGKTGGSTAFSTGTQTAVVSVLPVQAEPVSRIDVSIVRTPTMTSEVGEVNSLPLSESWIDEWDTFWAEIWVSTPRGDHAGVASARVDLLYDTACFTATMIEHGPAFTQDRMGTIDDGNGVVRGLGAGTLRTDVGDDAVVLLARVLLGSFLAEDAAGEPIPNDAAVTATPCGMMLAGGNATLVGGTQAEVQLGAPPATELWPVMYDLDDNGLVGPGDLSFFAAAYGKPAGAPGLTYSHACDFDGNGEIGPGDLSYFAPAYGRKHTDADLQCYPGNSPGVLRQANEAAASRLAERADAIVPIEKGLVTKSLIQTMPESSTAALDIALAEQYGQAIKPSSFLNRHAAWSNMVAWRQASRREDLILGKAALAVDLLLAD
ncbi:MAG TPA: hypothetical protein DD670_13870 [Planctomycetaceae bacterium]|nr:hypothetical protein [Planctomycetaceae bacterium]